MSDYKHVEIAPFLLARVAGGDSSKVDGILLTKTVDVIHKIIQQEVYMESVKESIEGMIFELVPTLTDEEKPLLRFILKFKRDVHNQRLPKMNRGHFDQLLRKLGNQKSEEIKGWYQAAFDRDKCVREVSDLFEQEVSKASVQLAKLMGNPEWQKGLILANTEYIRSYKADRLKKWMPRNQYARSSMSYLSRIVTKTSPFSTLTPLGLTTFDDKQSDSLRTGGIRSKSKITQALATSIVFGLVKDQVFSTLFNYECNLSIRQSNEKISYFKSNYTVLNGFSWRQDHLRTQEMDQDLVQVLKYLCGRRVLTYDQIQEVVSISDSDWTFQRLLDEQWIRPILPFSRRDQHTLLSIAEVLEGKTDRMTGQVACCLQQIDACVEKISTSDAAERLRLLGCVEKLIQKVGDLLSIDLEAYFKKSNYIYEDVCTDKRLPPLGCHIQEDLHKIGRMMRPYMFRTHVYDLLVKHFVERYGDGGTCYDIEDFLISFDQRKDTARLIKKAFMQDRKTALDVEEGRAISPISDSSAPPSATVFFQISSSSIDSVRDGDYTLVINQVNPGLGGLLSRFVSLFDSGGGNFSYHLRTWLEKMYPHAHILDLPIVADFSSLQIDSGVTEQSLRWSGENPTNEIVPDLLLKDLRLVHLEDNTLVLIDKNDEVVAPQYLGAIPHYLLNSVMGHFMTIINPWINAFQTNWSVSPLFSSPQPVEEVQFYPRIQEGRIVLRRARWRIPLYLFPLQEAGEKDEMYFLRLKKWQHEHQIPDEVFIAGERTSISFEAKKRKPMWFNFNSYHAIEAAIKSIVTDDLLVITFTEAHPTRADYWVGGNNGRYASEFLSLMRWSRR
ncbi:lantibiotic dehydratase [Bacillus sp. FSL W7-1360]